MTPNSVMYHKGIYNIQKIWNILKENQIANLIARLNNTGPAELTTWLRFKQAQIKNWKPINIIIESIPKDLIMKKNLTGTILKLANSLGITLRSF